MTISNKDSKKPKKTKENKERKLLVLLDSHAIIHRAYHALPDFMSSKGVPTGALYGLSTMLMGIIEKFKPEYVVACYDLPQPTYRHEAYKEYKSGRKKTDDALVEQLKLSRGIFEAFNIPIYDKVGFEADDLLGTIVQQVLSGKKPELENIDIMIASGDMDTLQLITGKRVKVFTLKKGIKDTVIYDENAVVERFGFEPKYIPDYKGLRGDTSDNIIGIAGIGEKTATTLISKFHTIEEMYKVLEKNSEAILALGITPRVLDLLKNGKEEAQFSKMLATIHRDVPVDFCLPKESWVKGLDTSKADALFREYEFRTLGAKLKQIVGKPINSTDSFDGEPVDNSVDKGDNFVDKNGNKDGLKTEYNPLFNQLDPMLEKRLKICLSVLHSNMTNPTTEDIFTFANTDKPEEIEQKIIEEVSSKGLGGVVKDIEWPIIPIVEKMEKDGIKIDVDFLKKLSREYHVKLAALEKEIWKLSETEFNVNSPKQLSEILFVKMGLGGKNGKRTSTGVRSTKESELEKMKGTHPIVDKILEYRELAKLLSTYIDVLPGLADKKGRIHAKFIQTGASTGRMSSQDPNMQNIPIRTEQGREIRRAFISEDGWSLLSLDYSQIQLRIAAILSGDENLITIFKKGIDVHSGVASQVFGVSEKEVTKEMRRQAKIINFGILYGMGVNALRTNLGSSREEAQKFYNDYFITFRGLASYLENTKKDAHKNGYTETMFGRKRYFEGIQSKLPFIRAAAERMAINAPIQGTEADIIKIAMFKIHQRLEREGLISEARLLLQVHDELVYEVRTPEIKKVAKIAKEEMESVLTEEQTKGVPITTSAEVGKNWEDMEELDM